MDDISGGLDANRLSLVDDRVQGTVEAESATDARTRHFEALADANLDASYRLARVILGDRTEAEDAVHDAFVTAWRKWSTLRDPSRFEAWFGRIVVNTCRDRLRRSSRRRESDLDAMPPRMTADHLDPIHERDRLSRAFVRLEPDHRVVLVLRYYRDLTVDDIAALLGVRPGTVKSRLHRAQRHLRDLLSTPEVRP